MWPLCAGLLFSGEHYNQLLQSQTSFPILCDENLTPCRQKREIPDFFILFFCFKCLHSQVRVTHWIYFALVRSLFFSLFCFVLFCPGIVFMGCVCCWCYACQQTCFYPIICFLKNPKRQTNDDNNNKERKKKMQKCCECMIESVTCRTAHFWQFCLPKEKKINSCIEERIEEEERKRFAVLYIKWCLFSILTLQVTSEGATSTGFCT